MLIDRGALQTFGVGNCWMLPGHRRPPLDLKEHDLLDCVTLGRDILVDRLVVFVGTALTYSRALFFC
jgi:hypothetical protein